MAFADATAPGIERQRSPIGLTLNLSSNNPFRNRATSPSPLNSPFSESPSKQLRPMSRNPFLDSSDYNSAPNRADAVTNGRSNAHAIPDDIFGELSLLDKPATDQAPQGARSHPRPLPPQTYRPGGPDLRQAPLHPSRGPGSPSKRDLRPPPPLQRRASESSVMESDRRPRIERDRADRPSRTASEERRRRERRKEREERHRREKEKIRAGDKKTRKPQGLDLIDKLDVTGIYGQGLFHHDGPFDACNPHRNAKKDRKAPMQAFPADSANMQLGGAGPLRSRLDLDKFHGRGVEGFTEFATTRKVAPAATIIDPKGAEYVHGPESNGLGTSTFLDGAPASKSALQRRDSEDPEVSGFGTSGGLSRKKSLAQRFRGMSNSRRPAPGDIRSPEGRYGAGSNDLESPAASIPAKAISAGGPPRARYNKENEVNPFENDYEAAFEKKGTQIRVAEQERPLASRPRAPSSPKQHLGLSRSLTSDHGAPLRSRGSSGEEERPSGGFLNRMRSLKGGPRRQRTEA
ncbi:hypothetical protein DOTSEDRAFT_68944 [Dothistroma septosporum NZE10]|uniref:Pal1-domain-containing protein n=1 Tax=Dothistroma septosporum (strain NZE10 / CBS 128990) TaxID=675120 RepID=N1Q3I2_DOTSN|nr:hypothetical protein DOTSEDRAFT_68944 [Dothistroma septosporum NZE10]